MSDPNEAISILRARAEALAQRPPDGTAATIALTLFTRGGQLYGLPLSDVEAAGRLKDLSPIPDAPPWMVGAIQVAGNVVTLVDLLRFWGLDGPGVADFPTYLILTDGQNRVGLLVEELQGVQEVDAALTPYMGVERLGITHVARHYGLPVPVLSAKRLLSDVRFQP